MQIETNTDTNRKWGVQFYGHLVIGHERKQNAEKTIHYFKKLKMTNTKIMETDRKRH